MGKPAVQRSSVADPALPAAAPRPAARPLHAERWAIVGGGVLGMTLAHRLAKAGHHVTLFEGADRLGGLAAPWTIGDVTWDRHYHVTLLSDHVLRSLLEELDLEREIEWVETKTGFYSGGRLISMSNSMEFLRFPPLSLIDKARLALTILYAARVKDWRRLERVPVEDWLRKWSGRHTFEAIWLPLLRSKLGESYRQTSAAFIWATIARMYAARRTGLKKEMFGYVPGGYDRILKRYSEVLAAQGVRIRLLQPTRRVDPGPSSVTVETAGGEREIFDQVVMTVPAPLAAELCPALSEDERGRLRGVRYQGIVCASVLLKKALSPFYVTNITDPGIPFTAVIEMTALVDPRHFGGRSLVYLPKYVPPDDAIFGLSDGEIEERFLAGLQRMHPQLDRQDVVSFRLSRVRLVFALTTLNYSDRLPPLTTTLPRVHVVNSAHVLNGTLNVNATLRLAESAAAGLLSPSRRAVLPVDGAA
jgi:protoporphyrinogen oxidase